MLALIPSGIFGSFGGFLYNVKKKYSDDGASRTGESSLSGH